MEKPSLYELLKPLIAFVAVFGAFMIGALLVQPKEAPEAPIGVSARDCAATCRHVGLEVRTWRPNDPEPGLASLGDCTCGPSCR